MIQQCSSLRNMLLVLVAVAQPLHAQWTKIDGSHGGSTVCLAVHGSDLFAGTAGGLFRSSDDGKHWVQRIPSIPGTVTCMAAFGDTLFAGTGDAGVFRSTDGGITGTQFNPGSISQNVKALLATPDGLGGTNLFAATGAGVYLLPDHGTVWSAMDSGLTNTNVLTLASELDGLGGVYLYAGTVGGVFLSTDNGSSWTQKNDGFPSPRSRIYQVYSLAVTDSGIFAAGIFAGPGSVYRSTDHGASWTAAGTLPGTGNNPLAAMGSILFALRGQSVYRSTDGGGSWSLTGPVFLRNISPATQTVISIAAKGSTVLVGTIAGVFGSTDQGVTWSALNDGLDASAVCPLAVSGQNVYAVGSGGYFITRSSDSGVHWVPWTGNTVSYRYSELAAYDSILVALTDFPLLGTGEFSPVLRYRTGGAHWDSIGSLFASALAITDAYIFTGGLFGVNARGVGRCSVDSSNWSYFDEGMTIPPSIYALAAEGSTVCAGRLQMGVSLSIDNGVHWSQVNNGFDTTTSVTALVINGPNIFAGTSTVIGFPGVPRGIFRTTDHGAHWSTVNNGLTDTSIVALALHGTTILAATDSGGVFVSTNNGGSWSPFNDGLPRLSMSSLAISDTYIYAGVVGGLWRRPLSETVTSVPGPASVVPGRYALEQNYPNPFNPSTTIRYGLPTRSHVALTVFNSLGQQVTTLVHEEQESGYHDVKFDGSNLASGVYFYRIQAGSFVQTKKLVILK